MPVAWKDLTGGSGYRAITSASPEHVPELSYGNSTTPTSVGSPDNDTFAMGRRENTGMEGKASPMSRDLMKY